MNNQQLNPTEPVGVCQAKSAVAGQICAVRPRLARHSTLDSTAPWGRTVGSGENHV